MEISKQAKNELKQIHLKKTGELLTDIEIEEMAQDLFYLFYAIYNPLPKNRDNQII